MSLSQRIKNQLSLLDWRFYLRFLALFLPLYFGNLLVWGLVDPKNYYSPFVDQYLNYFKPITASILHTSNAAINLLGIPSTVNGKILTASNGALLSMDVPCIGLGIMFFWFAFIVAGRSSVSRKIKWCTAGLAAIWFINCCRVFVLLLSIEKQWDIGRYVDAHDMFNYAAYGIVLFMIWLEGRYNVAAKELNGQPTQSLVPTV